MKEDLVVPKKFQDYDGHGISAPQVLTFLDQISIMLKAVSGDIDRAIEAIQTTVPMDPKDVEETTEETTEETEEATT